LLKFADFAANHNDDVIVFVVKEVWVYGNFKLKKKIYLEKYIKKII